jgi:hypothetical protein
MMDNKSNDGRPPNERFTKAVFGVMALGSVVAGLLLYLFHDAIGIDADTARIIATAFLIVGIADTVLLWDRIFKRRP